MIIKIINSMFYFWHTSLVVLFIAVAYYLGFKYGEKAKATKKSKLKVWKVLKQPPQTFLAHGGSAGPILFRSDKETPHEDWIKGYRRWQKTNQKQNDHTSK